jgi:hypothetical protein
MCHQKKRCKETRKDNNKSVGTLEAIPQGYPITRQAFDHFEIDVTGQTDRNTKLLFRLFFFFLYYVMRLNFILPRRDKIEHGISLNFHSSRLDSERAIAKPSNTFRIQ